jgi:hypothetical protein
MLALSKLKGTITETYDSIQTNQNLLASAFEAALQTHRQCRRPAGAQRASRPWPGS